ncbi:hypothetical protein BN57_542 [Bifidobacterium longum subsp. longum CECT 7347]|nr:hypothetical protein BN57_542 [Bifidobacterium longum subsp. longum CECT 7347]
MRRDHANIRRPVTTRDPIHSNTCYRNIFLYSLAIVER